MLSGNNMQPVKHLVKTYQHLPQLEDFIPMWHCYPKQKWIYQYTGSVLELSSFSRYQVQLKKITLTVALRSRLNIVCAVTSVFTTVHAYHSNDKE